MDTIKRFLCIICNRENCFRKTASEGCGTEKPANPSKSGKILGYAFLITGPKFRKYAFLITGPKLREYAHLIAVPRLWE
ncbi:MAG: hypothetical protein AB3K77_04355 [Methanosarcinaceae archaeon]|uniref:hypothetical protein n=1 Tax=Methanosarcina sp. MTP4 TaxID=1434100 RepID=UPI0012E0B619|nr:hypothetical protein [Methanosarcina sp. MTP4]